MSFRSNQRYQRTDNQRMNQYQPSQARFVTGPQTIQQQQQLGNVRFAGNSTIPTSVVTSRVQGQPQNVFNTLQPATAATGAAPWGSGMVVQQGQQPAIQQPQMQPATFQNPAMPNMQNMQSMPNMQNAQQNQANMMGLITNPQILAQAAGLVATPGLGIQVPFAGPGILGPGPIRGQLSQVYQSVGQTGLGSYSTQSRTSRSSNKESGKTSSKDKRSFDRSRSRSRERHGRDKRDDIKDGRREERRDKGDKNMDRRDSRKSDVKNDNRRDSSNFRKNDRRDDKKDDLRDDRRDESKSSGRGDKSNERKDNKKDNRRDDMRKGDRSGDKRKLSDRKANYDSDTGRRGQRSDNYDSDTIRRNQRGDNYDSDSGRRGQRSDNYDSDTGRRGSRADNYDSDSARRGSRGDNRDNRNRSDIDRSKDKGRKTNQGNRGYRDGNQSDATSPDQKRMKKGKDNIKRRTKGDRDSGSEDMYDDILEEEIPAWLRCSPSDLYFNRDNQMFKDTTLVYACIGGRDLHVGLDCDEFHLVPGAVISQLTVEALQRVSQIQGHKTVYFIAGVPDLLTTLSSPGYEETIFEDRNLFDTYYGQMRQTDMALKLHNCHVIFSTVSSMSIREYNENNKKQGKTYTLRFERNYPEMQENLHRLLKQINNTITSINTRQKLLTPFIHSYINKKSEKNKIVYRLDKLLDGLNPCGTIIDGWRKCMNRTILRNKVMMSKPDFVMKM